MDIKVTLKAARINAGMTQADVAKAMQRSKGTIAHWENGDTKVRKTNLRWMSELYGIPVDNLLVPERKK